MEFWEIIGAILMVAVVCGFSLFLLAAPLYTVVYFVARGVRDGLAPNKKSTPTQAREVFRG